MYLKRQIFLVFGLSRSGKAAANYLLAQGASVYVHDEIESDRIAQTIAELEEKGAKRLSKEKLTAAPTFCDALVLSPGIPIDHPLAVSFKRSGKGVISECELAVRCMRLPMIAVTGTNGKTTTVSMLTDVLKAGGLSAVACGNIGMPILEALENETGDIAVAEISSFQLETLSSHCPHIAVVLNLTEDHLNRHYSMENYIFLKQKLLKNLTETEFAVLNYDDLTVRAFAEKTKAKVLYFSLKEKVCGGYLEKGDLYFGKEKIMSVDEVSIGGMHNLQNALAAMVAAKIMGVSSADIASALSSFKGVNHRIQTVEEVSGITFINDSKGTNVDATLKAVFAMKMDTVLLLGGKDKGYHYDALFAELKKSCVTHAVLYGENRFTLLQCARAASFDNISLCAGFEMAVRLAIMQAKSGQAVLLSPASASFDAFANYEERGDKFVEIVRQFAQEERNRESAQKASSVLEENEQDE